MSVGVDVAHGRGQCDAGGLQGEARGGTGRGADHEALAVLLISVSVRESRSAMISGHELVRLSAAMRFAHQLVGALAHAQDIQQAASLQLRHGLCADHAA